ncbi:MAG: T9SS type A sorting domain-containing protein [Flavobacteriales bacterium]|nr:T9SS type A sorting domain-containing protein [Flavobacteriales bacterium]
MKYLLTISFCLFSFFSKAQITFEKVYSDSGITTAYDIIATLDGGYAATGFKTCSFFGCQDFFLLKLDSLGNQEWVRLYDGFSTDDKAYSLIQTSDSGYVLAGGASVPPNFGGNIRLLKTDKNGNKLWDRNYGGLNEEGAWDIEETFDTGFIIAAQYDTTASLIKTDALGLIEWQKDYTHLYGSGYAIKQLSDSSYIMTGTTLNKITSSSGEDIFLLKANKNGDTLWTKFYGQGNERGQDVIITSGGDYLIVGYTTGVSSLVGAYIIKTNNQGDTIWTQIFEPGTNQNVFYRVVQDGNNYVCVGYSTPLSPPNTNLYVLKINDSGTKIWERFYEYQLNSGEGAQSIALTNDGGYIICGNTDPSGAASAMVYIVKTDTSGLIIGIDDIDTPEFNLNVYPNPFNNYTTIDFNELYDSNNITVELYDFTGRLLFQQTVNEPKTILYNKGYAKGIYLLTIKNNNKLITTKKLIIN